MKCLCRSLIRSAGFFLFSSVLLTFPVMSDGDKFNVASAPENENKRVLGDDGTRDLMKGVMGSVLPPGVHPDALPDPTSVGAQVLQRYCTQCHELPGPGLHTAEEWPEVVSRMQNRILRLSKKEKTMIAVRPLSTRDLESVVAYLRAHGYQPIDESAYPDLDTDIGIAFRATCSRCHALPDPSLHTADRWRSVVLRMRKNMEILGVADPGDAEIAKVIGFLQAHAKK